MPRPGLGRGLGLGQAGGTEQQHPTPLLKRETEENEEEAGGLKRRTGGGVQSTTHHVGITYIFITITYNFYFGSRESGVKEKVCVCGQGLGALGHQEKCFYFYFWSL